MNPYKDLPPTAFWKTAVGSRSCFDIGGIWKPKFQVDCGDPFITYGSCFAAHIGKALSVEGYNWLVTEEPPPGVDMEISRQFNYNVFSSRTGNIYTSSLLKQWVEWAAGTNPVPREFWPKGNRFIDPFRPRIEPDGFAAIDELVSSRLHTLEAFRESITKARYFFFTLGLSESWIDKRGWEYPLCPGTFAGEFDSSVHHFINQSHDEILENLQSAIFRMRELNPDLKFILTVSPVPLAATMSGQHVLIATMDAKSKLRSAAGQIASDCDFVDYFPSYEIISSPPFRAVFFEPDLRGINSLGVRFVMSNFIDAMHNSSGISLRPTEASTSTSREPANCDEEILQAFANTET